MELSKVEMVKGADVLRQSPEILYKFRSWDDDYGKRTITKNELYLTSPKDFDDTKDCQLPLDFNVSEAEFIEYAKELILEEQPLLSALGIHKKLATAIANFKEVHFRTNFEKRYHERFATDLGVLCLSSKCDNFEMWKKFKDTGFCIGLKYALLTDDFRWFNEIHYVD